MVIKKLSYPPNEHLSIEDKQDINQKRLISCRQMEPCSSDSHRLALHPGAAVRPQSRRPASQRRRRTLEGQRGN